MAVEVSPGRPPLDSEARSGLAVALPDGLRVEVARRFDAGTLAQLLAVLERV